MKIKSLEALNLWIINECINFRFYMNVNPGEGFAVLQTEQFFDWCYFERGEKQMPIKRFSNEEEITIFIHNYVLNYDWYWWHTVLITEDSTAFKQAVNFLENHHIKYKVQVWPTIQSSGDMVKKAIFVYGCEIKKLRHGSNSDIPWNI